MKNEIEIHSLILSDDNREKVLRDMAFFLEEKGWVDNGYADAVIKRENEFPTGVPSEPIPIAIPHAGRNHVKRKAILIARLMNEIEFYRMDQPTSTLPVKVIFMLAIDSNDQELEIIMKVMEMVQNNKLINSIASSEDSIEIEKMVIDFIKNN